MVYTVPRLSYRRRILMDLRKLNCLMRPHWKRFCRTSDRWLMYAAISRKESDATNVSEASALDDNQQQVSIEPKEKYEARWMASWTVFKVNTRSHFSHRKASTESHHLLWIKLLICWDCSCILNYRIGFVFKWISYLCFTMMTAVSGKLWNHEINHNRRLFIFNWYAKPKDSRQKLPYPTDRL